MTAGRPGGSLPRGAARGQRRDERKPGGPSRGARLAALLALDDWSEGRTDFLDEALARHAPADERDAALARELALGAARHGLLYDHLAATFLKRGRQPTRLLLALRLGCHQLLALDRVPPHAAVGETVEALRQVGERGLVGVANAVLRKLAALRLEQRGEEGPLGRLARDVWPEDLATRHGIPRDLADDLRPVAPEPFEAALAALDHVAPLCTRSRPGKPLPVGQSILRREGPWTWWDDPQEALRGPVADGIAVVQDPAQLEPVELARVRPGELVLDLCAAPGGKSLALIDRGARVVSADLSPAKLRAFAEAPRRVAQDGARPALAGGFDLVLVDAPCSNTGVLARRPEARWRYDARRLAALGSTQRALLRSAARLAAPDGRIVYATCSLSPRENQAVAHGLDGWRVLGEKLTWPDRWHAGGYAALLVR